MSRVPLPADPLLASWATRAFDREGKLVRALTDLAPIADRDVAVVGAVPPWLTARLRAAGARVQDQREPEETLPAGTDAGTDAGTADRTREPAADAADVVLGAWLAFRDAIEAEVVAARSLLRPEGRLLAIQDYGRDDIDPLMGDRPESTTWSRRDGPFVAAGFRIRVVHCWWTFTSMDEAGRFLADAFGEAGVEVVGRLHRPRLAHNLAIYHRDATPT